jgi:hypothetical protein
MQIRERDNILFRVEYLLNFAYRASSSSICLEKKSLIEKSLIEKKRIINESACNVVKGTLRFLILHFLNRDRSWLEDRINPDEHEHNLCNIYIQYFYKIPDNQVDRSVSNQIAQRVGNYNRLFDNALAKYHAEFS